MARISRTKLALVPVGVAAWIVLSWAAGSRIPGLTGHQSSPAPSTSAPGGLSHLTVPAELAGPAGGRIASSGWQAGPMLPAWVSSIHPCRDFPFECGRHHRVGVTAHSMPYGGSRPRG